MREANSHICGGRRPPHLSRSPKSVCLNDDSSTHEQQVDNHRNRRGGGHGDYNGTGTNYSRWINDAATDAIAAAATTSNLDERAAYYQTACEQITAELPHIYLYDRGEIHLARNNVSGFVVNVFENSMTWNAQEWDIE